MKIRQTALFLILPFLPSLVPNVEESLSYLPTKSPLLTANLLVSLGE